MRSFLDMTDEMLGEEIEKLFHLQSILMVHSQLPARHRKQHHEYQAHITEIEREQDERAKAHTTIAQQDTLHIVW